MTIKLILDFKLKKAIDCVKNLILFDDDYSVSEEQATNAGLKLSDIKTWLMKDRSL